MSRSLSLFFKGERGKKRKWILIAVVAAVAVLAVVLLLLPDQMLLEMPEIRRIESAGALIVGVRADAPGFCVDGEGFEAELAALLAARILPGEDEYARLRLVEVSAQSAAAKLSDGTVDAVIALMVTGAEAAYSYTQPYYMDDVVVAVAAGTDVQLADMRVGYIDGSPCYDHVAGISVDAEGNTLMDMRLFASYPDMLEALLRGDIGAAALSGAYFDKYAEEYSLVEYTRIDDVIGYSIVTNSEAAAVGDIANMLIAELAESGELAEMIARHGLAR
ncbi:MAG: transporter substrate-binding domain-containing protein [Clostridia bacterium]|nr:transporter substrate-binding domain-containing protein [Clostridia bacterium]